ncbi:MAG: phosphomannomutase/phosphoglucomutase [Gammaproteobacteria bacterium]|nr:phosphomannomutase/phosphoglucomutase [Gammaproteobacteria bacterium]
MSFSPEIFRQYDIRGIVGETIDNEVARATGSALVTAVSARAGDAHPRIVVGSDNRPSSDGLADALSEGIRSAGGHVISLGTVPTPVTYWAERELAAAGGAQITGSHNPPEWNGIKMTVGGRPLYGEGIQELRRRIDEGVARRGPGTLERVDVLDRYVADIAGRFEEPMPLKVVVDCANASGSLTAVPVLEAIGAEVIPLYCELDGTFPNHHPDPTVDENIVDLAARVRRTGAALGVGFDGDADRIGVVDETGAVVRGDILLLLFGLEVLERRGPGEKLVFDVKCSQVLPRVFEAAGGIPVMWATGHSLIKEKMHATGAVIGGELSGHICFADEYIGVDDAVYAACRLLRLLAASGRSLSALVADLPRYASTPEYRIEVAEHIKHDIAEAAREHFSRSHEVIAVDGARILFDGGWGLLRASNTQPVLAARYEADTDIRLGEIRREVEDWLRARGVGV